MSNVRVFPCVLLGCSAEHSTAIFKRHRKAAITSALNFQVQYVHTTTPLQSSAHTALLSAHMSMQERIMNNIIRSWCRHKHMYTHTYVDIAYIIAGISPLSVQVCPLRCAQSAGVQGVCQVSELTHL